MTSSSAFARGDVVTVEFPFADGAGSKDRPAVVVAGPSPYGDYTVVMISKERHVDGVSITRADFASGSLNTDSFVRVSRLFTVDGGTVIGKRGTLKLGTVARVNSMLCPM